MKPTDEPYIAIWRNNYGDAVCYDCGKPFSSCQDDRAMVIDGDLVCWDCIKKWAEDDFTLFMEYMTEKRRDILYQRDVEKLIGEDDRERELSVTAWLRETFSGKE